jgi:hypothetical protein
MTPREEKRQERAMQKWRADVIAAREAGDKAALAHLMMKKPGPISPAEQALREATSSRVRP